jgi:sulfite exporter TauE/SafE/copper chaperone CopZ
MTRIVREEFRAEGMTCTGCEKIIERQVLDIEGVKNFKIDYATQEGWVTFDEEVTDIDTILDRIEKKGYECKLYERSEASSRKTQRNLTRHIKPAALTLGLVAILFGGYQFAEGTLGIGIFPEVGASMSLALLFVLGLLTGFHCIGMCGGFVMSYASGNSSKTGSRFLNIGSHLQYGSGKMISYTLIGALFGLIGSVFVFTPLIRGVAAILAGGFLMIFGLNMLNVFPALRKVRIPQPGFVSRLSIRGRGNGSPMKIGLLNGLMIACGPLQAIYIYSAGTGSVAAGALASFAFGLGTLPILFGFGMFASYVSKTMTRRILKVSGIIVLVLGVVMLNRGMALTGMGFDFNTVFATVSASESGNATVLTPDGYQEIHMDVTRYGWSPDKFVLKAGVPVRWVINGKEITGCNNAIQVPQLGLSFDIKKGEQVIEFTPESEGTIPWSCWMGMIPGVFIVKDDVDLSSTEDVQRELASVEVPSGGTCGCGGG